MKSKSQIEIVTETTREVTFRLERRGGGGGNRGEGDRSLFGEKCSLCALSSASAGLLTLNEAVQCSGLIWDEIIRLVENGSVHAVETMRGEMYVCAESLLNFNRKEIKK